MATFESMTCARCANIVDKVTSTGIIVFKCRACNKERKSVPSDTLMASGSLESIGADDQKYERILRYASNFPINPKPDPPVKCPHCNKSTYVRYLRLGHKEEIFYVCNHGEKNITDFVFT